jgi:HEPN domain-containing protein
VKVDQLYLFLYNAPMTDWIITYQREMALAVTARERKNEGQARVCARRAAGIVIREYYQQRGIRISTPSAYDLLKLLMEDFSQPEAVRQSAAYLTLRVTEEFKLPVDVDLIKEAESIARVLFPEAL